MRDRLQDQHLADLDELLGPPQGGPEPLAVAAVPRRRRGAQPGGQLGAPAQGGTYAKALEAMDEESGAVTQRAGDYLVAFVQENAEGMYELADGRLVWREAAEEANVHLEIAVADAADGRFVPALDITLTVLDGDRELFTTTMPFLWHPYLYHYGTNARVPGEGPYTVRVRIDPPAFMRHDPVNGKRYEEAVELVFADRRFTPGRKPSPDATPRGEDAPFAG